jgi:CTP synthase
VSKFIFVTGGVCSSLGKGITAASLGCLLEHKGLKVSLMKIDPYLNVDPGTMSPYQHGEVFVTADGAETDLDLGNYERFTSIKVSQDNSITTGQIYYTVIERERKGDYLGSTVQVIPHITDEIKNRIRLVSEKSDADVLIVEIGGTVGDIESIPFLEAIRQFALDISKENVLYIHVTLLPVISTAGEAKTKPTQHSVKELREIGIQPDILLCRTQVSLDDDMINKIALFSNVSRESVIEGKDVEDSIYEVPIQYSKAGLDNIAVKKLGLKDKVKDMNMKRWEDIVNTVKKPEHTTNIAVIGKYTELPDAYKSVYEAIMHGAIANKGKAKIIKLLSDSITEANVDYLLKDVDGVVIPGGFGVRGIEGKIAVLKYTRENNIPSFGLCLGMQCMVIEFARNVCGLKEANSTEFEKETKYPVISLLEEQKGVKSLGGTMRLGSSETVLLKKTKAYDIYNTKIISERHRHRYEFNGEYRRVMETHGLEISGISAEKGLVEITSVKSHPWYIGVQYHPEFQSKPTNAHPLFRDFMKAALLRSKEKEILLAESGNENKA